MPLWSCNVGTSWVIVKASDENAARFALADRLGLQSRPWLWRDMPVRRATVTDIHSYGALADATTGSRTKGKGKHLGESTATKLLRENEDQLFPDNPDEWFGDDAA